MREPKISRDQVRLLEKAYYALALGREDGALLLNGQKQPEEVFLVFSDVESLYMVFYDIGGMEREEIEQELEVLESLGLMSIDKERKTLKLAFRKARGLIFEEKKDRS